MPEGDLRGSLMRLNSPNQFPASSGYFICQDMTTKADDTPRPEPWHPGMLRQKGMQTPPPPASLQAFPGVVCRFSRSAFPRLTKDASVTSSHEPGSRSFQIVGLGGLR